MSLADLQRALGTRVAARSSPGAFTAVDLDLAGMKLTEDEAAWLRSLEETPGLLVTAHVARWWRETKLQMMARLTLMALVRTGGESLVQRYLDVTACRTLFFLPEACAFLTFIAESEAASPHAAAIASFERALIEAREAAAGRAGTKSSGDRQHTIIAFPAPAEVLLAALVSGEALPDVAARASYVEVSSDLPQLWRPIDVEPFDA